jgi:hypothetical protein
MIEFGSETLLTFSQAAAELPRRRQGKRVSTVTLWRWATKGVDGVTLETLRTPSGRVTTREALARFLEALTQRGQSYPSSSGPSPGRYRSPARRQRDSERAERELLGPIDSPPRRPKAKAKPKAATGRA